jgi:hypothetical protein
MDAIHAIDRVDLDFSFDDTVLSSDSDLAAWVRSDLLVAVDEVLCDQDDETMLVIDRLEIDLGEVDGIRGTTEVVARLRERLAMAIRAARNRRSFDKYDLEPISDRSAAEMSDIFWSSSESDLLVRHATLDPDLLRILLEALDAWQGSLLHPTTLSVQFWKQVAVSAQHRLNLHFPEENFGVIAKAIRTFAQHSIPDWNGLLRALPSSTPRDEDLEEHDLPSSFQDPPVQRRTWPISGSGSDQEQSQNLVELLPLSSNHADNRLFPVPDVPPPDGNSRLETSEVHEGQVEEMVQDRQGRPKEIDPLFSRQELRPLEGSAPTTPGLTLSIETPSRRDSSLVESRDTSTDPIGTETHLASRQIQDLNQAESAHFKRSIDSYSQWTEPVANSLDDPSNPGGSNPQSGFCPSSMASGSNSADHHMLAVPRGTDEIGSLPEDPFGEPKRQILATATPIAMDVLQGKMSPSSEGAGGQDFLSPATLRATNYHESSSLGVPSSPAPFGANLRTTEDAALESSPQSILPDEATKPASRPIAVNPQCGQSLSSMGRPIEQPTNSTSGAMGMRRIETLHTEPIRSPRDSNALLRATYPDGAEPAIGRDPIDAREEVPRFEISRDRMSDSLTNIAPRTDTPNRVELSHRKEESSQKELGEKSFSEGPRSQNSLVDKPCDQAERASNSAVEASNLPLTGNSRITESNTHPNGIPSDPTCSGSPQPIPQTGVAMDSDPSYSDKDADTGDANHSSPFSTPDHWGKDGDHGAIPSDNHEPIHRSDRRQGVDPRTVRNIEPSSAIQILGKANPSVVEPHPAPVPPSTASGFSHLDDPSNSKTRGADETKHPSVVPLRDQERSNPSEASPLIPPKPTDLAEIVTRT